MKPTSFITALLAAVATMIVAFPSAFACSVMPATPQAIVPVNGDRVGPSVEILVIGGGEGLAGAGEFSLSDRSGNQIDVEAEVISRAGLLEWIIVYRPTESLSPTAYDFFASYPTQEQDPATISTSFEVRQQDAATLMKPQAITWDTALFTPQVDGNGMCEAFSSATRLRVEQAREGDSPLWYEVELSNEDRSEAVTHAVVPGAREDDAASLQREFHEQFAVGCVAVTPVGPAGERGETFESCEAALCGTADGEEVVLDNLWESLDECGGSAPGQPTPGGSTGGSSSSDEGCSVRGMVQPSSPWWAGFAVLLVAAKVRRRE
jgi:hypothetical protein